MSGMSDDFTAVGLEMLREAGFPVAGIHCPSVDRHGTEVHRCELPATHEGIHSDNGGEWTWEP